MAAKVCPRCGSLFQSLKSATCPQCFAILETIDDETAQELAAALAKEESSEEYQAAKKQDNEQWAEQSFKACLGVVGITILTLIVCVIILVAALHHNRAKPLAAATPVPTAVSVPMGIGPSTAALPDELLPAVAGLYTRTALESDIMIPGLTDSIIHGSYALNGGAARTFDVFVIRHTSLETNADAFQLGCSMAARVGGSATRPITEVATSNWTFAVIGDTEPDGIDKADDLAKQLTSSPNN